MASNNLRDIIFFSIKDHIIDKDFYIVNADFTGRPFIAIAKEYSERFIQVGIAEQNMIAVACGLALTGKKVVTYSPNPFEYLRAYDQIRNAVCMMGLPITIVANGYGLVNTNLGATHFTTEDYQLFSLCPNMQIFTISDENIAKMVTDYIVNGVSSPTYVRIDFECDGVIASEEDIDFNKGYRLIKRGKECAIITQGYTVRTAIKADFLIQPTIIEIFRRPYNQSMLLKELQEYKKIIVLEEQQLRGGLGSELLEICNQNRITIDIECLGIDYGEQFPHMFGKREFWMKEFGIDSESLKEKVEKNYEKSIWR